VRANDARRREIDEVPVVDAIGIREIGTKDVLSVGRVTARIAVDEDDEREEPRLVPLVVKQLLGVGIDRSANSSATTLVAGTRMPRSDRRRHIGPARS
jgi:hypothetical protein